MKPRCVFSVFVIIMLLTPMVPLLGQLELEPVDVVKSITDYSIIDKELGVLTLQKWDVSIDISLDDSEPISSRDLIDKTELTYLDYKSEIYETDTGIEWDIILPSFPKTNVFSYQVEGSKQLNWYYQPALNPADYPKEYVVNDTHAFDDKGNLIDHRPVNAVGSYAVYGDRQGNEYMTGKIMHVYRPLIIDAHGESVWGNLVYYSGILSVVVPSDFLASAVYPVRVDPSFGYTSLGVTSNAVAEYIRASNFTSGVGQITSITTYLNNAADNVINFDCAIYNTSLYLINETETLLLTVDEDGWYTFHISDGAMLTGNEVWLANWANDTCTIYYDTGQPTTSYIYKQNTEAQHWFNPITVPNYGTSILSIYANYTLAGGSPVSCTFTTPLPEYYNDTQVLLDITPTNNVSSPIYNLFNETDDSWVYGANQTYTVPVNLIDLADSEGYTIHVWVSNASGAFDHTSRFAIDEDGYKSVSGSAADVEAVIAEAVIAGGPQSVYIPMGTFNITDSAPMNDIDLPEGINLIGALTERDAYGNVTLWRTKIQLPWFYNTSLASPKIPFITVVEDAVCAGNITRISDIEFIGYRVWNQTDLMGTMQPVIIAHDIYELRIDHCKLNNTGGNGFTVVADGDQIIKTVIDHNWMINDYGNPYGTGEYGTETLGYGVFYTSGYPYFTDWDNQTLNEIGQYKDHTLFFEDNTVDDWRHVISSNHGVSYTARNNVILEGNWGYSIWDQHGGDAATLSGRVMETYNNIIHTTNNLYFRPRYDHYRGGSGVVFNETIEDFYDFVAIKSEVTYMLGQSAEWSRDIWVDVSSCTLDNITINVYKESDMVNYTLGMPPGYVAYPYPHPLTLQTHLDNFATYNTQPTWQISGGITVTETYVDTPDTWDINKDTGYNTTEGGTPCLLSTYWLDDGTLDQYWYSTNNTGAFTDTTATAFGASHWANETITLNSTVGQSVWIRAIANDTAGLTAYSPYQILTTSSTAPNAPTINTPVNLTRYDPSEAFNLSWTFSDPNLGDIQSAYEVEIDNDPAYGSPEIDTGKVTSANAFYIGTAPTTVHLYYARVRTWDSYDEVGPWNSSWAIITDRVILLTLTVNDATPDVGEVVTITATAELEYDHHPLIGTDTLNLQTNAAQNIAMTYNGVAWTGTHTEAAAATRLVNTAGAVNETTHDITTLSMNGYSVTVTWGNVGVEAEMSSLRNMIAVAYVIFGIGIIAAAGYASLNGVLDIKSVFALIGAWALGAVLVATLLTI